MTWTTIESLVTSNPITQARWQQQLQGNLNHLHAIIERNALNGSGAARAVGDVVAFDSTTDGQVVTTTTPGYDSTLVGVAVTSMGSAGTATGDVAVVGYVPALKITGAVTRYQPLQTAGTAGWAQAGTVGAFALAAQANASGTALISAYLLPRLPASLPQVETYTPVVETTAGTVTYTAAQVLDRLILRDPNGGSRNDTLPSAASLVSAAKGVGTSTRNGLEFSVRNDADAAETISLLAGSGVTIYGGGTPQIAQGQTAHFLARFTNVTASSEAVTIYSLGIGAH